MKLHRERLAIFEQLGDTRSRAVTLGDIARILVDKGQVDEAMKLHRERLAVYVQLGDADGRANALWSIARIEMERKQAKEALEHLTESYAILQGIGRLDGICMVGIDLGMALCAGGAREKGLEILKRSLDGLKQLGQSDLARQVQGLIDRIEGQAG